jgi:hypothetical protein
VAAEPLHRFDIALECGPLEPFRGLLDAALCTAAAGMGLAQQVLRARIAPFGERAGLAHRLLVPTCIVIAPGLRKQVRLGRFRHGLGRGCGDLGHLGFGLGRRL